MLSLLLSVFSAGMVDSTEKPRALLQMIEARKAIVRADVFWSTASPARANERGGPTHCRTLIAGDEIAHTIIGNNDGVTVWNEHGEPANYSPFAQLTEKGAYWHYKMSDTEVDKVEGDVRNYPTVDFRSLGLAPIPTLRFAPEELLDRTIPRGAKSVTFDEARLPDGQIRVTADADQGEARVVWYIDPTLDWNATKVEQWRKDKLVTRCMMEYQRANGIVVPLSALYLGADGQVVYHAQVASIDVNDPALPSDLTPEFIGVEPGYTVWVTGNPAIRSQQTYVGDGKHSDASIVFSMIHRGELKPGERVTRLRNGEPVTYELPDPKQVKIELEELRKRLSSHGLDEWEIYTREFSRRFGLDDEQQQKAVQILKQCQARRDHYLHSVAAQKNTLETNVNKTMVPAESEELAAQLLKLQEPVTRIFEQDLKPRLELIPTRRQRADVDSRTTQP